MPLVLAAALALTGCESGAARSVADAAALASLPAPRAYACGTPLAPDDRAAAAELAASWTDWKERYVTARGARGLLRVTMAQADDASSSEGIGYGMLLAAYLGDRPVFDALWGYAKAHHNRRGLMAWEVKADGRVPDRGAATDADEDMAFALLAADARWGGYAGAGRALIDSLMVHTVEPGTLVVKPGDGWGGSAVTNPSYLAPAYYKAFAAAASDPRWERVADASYAILDRVAEKHGRGTGLQPDWVTAAGDSAPGGRSASDDGFEFDYGYGATRVPWRLAMDAAWSCDPRAQRHLARLNAFFRGVGAGEIRDGYRLDGTPTGKWHNAAFVAPVMTAALFSEDARYRAELWEETVELRAGEYYHDSLRLLGLLLGSGRMPPPSRITAADGRGR